MQSVDSFESVELNMVEFAQQPSAPAPIPKKISKQFIIMLTCIFIALLCTVSCAIYFIRSNSNCDESSAKTTLPTTTTTIHPAVVTTTMHPTVVTTTTTESD